MEISENRAKMLRGELYFAFTPELIELRRQCERASEEFNTAGAVSRRRRIEMWRSITGNKEPLPARASTEEADEELLSQEPWITPPIRMDYGTNIAVGQGTFINFNCSIIDTCRVSIGARVLFGPNVSLYSGTHPEDPLLRNGTAGPESGKEIIIEDDVWIGGNVVILAGVRIGRGSVIGAGSVVTKSVPPLWVAVGNPAQLLREIKTSLVVGPSPDVVSISPATDMKPMAQHR